MKRITPTPQQQGRGKGEKREEEGEGMSSEAATAAAAAAAARKATITTTTTTRSKKGNYEAVAEKARGKQAKDTNRNATIQQGKGILTKKQPPLRHHRGRRPRDVISHLSLSREEQEGKEGGREGERNQTRRQGGRRPERNKNDITVFLPGGWRV